MRSGAGLVCSLWRDWRTVAHRKPYRGQHTTKASRHRGTAVTPFITDRPSAHAPASARNFHIPYGLYLCPDGAQVLHDRNYVPTYWRPGDGVPAQPVPLLADGGGRWCQYQQHGYFFVRGSHPLGMRSTAKSVWADIARGEEILAKFLKGAPVWSYLIKADTGVPTGWF